MQVNVAETLFRTIDTATQSQMANMNTVMSVMGIVIGGIWMTYILMKSLYWYFEGLTTVIQDAFFTIFKAFAIMMASLTISWYTSTVIPPVLEFPLWLANTIAGVNNDSSNLVDMVINSYISGLENLVDKMKFGFSVSSIKSMVTVGVAVVLYLLSGLPFLGVAIATLLTLKVATNLILIIGPMFIACLAFPKVAHWFWGWVGVLGGFVLTQALFAITLGMAISFINSNMINNGDFNILMVDIICMSLYFSAFTLLATEIPNYAASIMGGAPSGGVGSMSRLLGKATGFGAASHMSKALGSKLVDRFHGRGKGRIS
ncbi:TPA: type IV secretion system protein [Escherichia coli]